MNPRAKVKQKRAESKACREMVRIFIKAEEAGADPYYLLAVAYALATRKKDPPFQAKATRESRNELRLRQPRRTGEQPVCDPASLDLPPSKNGRKEAKA